MPRKVKVYDLSQNNGEAGKVRALNKLMECDEYRIESAIVFDDDAMDVVGKVFYAPIYMVMFLKKDSHPANMIYDVGKPLEL